MKQYLIINRLFSILYHQSSVVCPLHLSRILYKSTLFMQNKPNFRKSQMNLNIFSTKAYENKSNRTLGENKPNSNPIKPKTNPIPKIAKMNLNIYYKKDYSNNTANRRIQNKPNSKPIQTQTNPICRGLAPDEAVFSFDLLARPVILKCEHSAASPTNEKRTHLNNSRQERKHIMSMTVVLS